LVLKISKAGKHIEEQFAHKYYDEIGLGIDFTARDIQAQCKEKVCPGKKPNHLTTVRQLEDLAVRKNWR